MITISDNENIENPKKVRVPGPLHDVSDLHTVVFTDEVKDSQTNKSQEELNEYFVDVAPERDGTKGMKYIILRPGTSLQSQIDGAAIYEIRDNFNLNTANLVISEGSVLYFKGGSLSNGAVTLNNTAIYPSYNKLDNVTVSGYPAIGTEKVDQSVKYYWNGTTWVSAENLIAQNSSSLTNYVDSEIAKIAPVEHVFTASYVAGSDYRKLFSLTTNNYAIIAVSVTIMGKSWSDILYYSSSLNRDKYYFYTNSHQYFFESRASFANPVAVCMPNKKSPMAPAATVRMQVIKSSGTVTWYDNEPVYAVERIYDVLNSKIVADELDFSLSTYCETNVSEELVTVSGEAVVIQNNELYTVNASASSGNFTIPTRNYKNVNMYCFGAGVATLGEETLAYSDGDVIHIEGTHMSIVDNPKEYYTKPEVDTFIGEINNTKESKSNKVTNINQSSTNNEYPSAKAVYDLSVEKQDKDNLDNTSFQTGSSWASGSHYPSTLMSAKAFASSLSNTADLYVKGESIANNSYFNIGQLIPVDSLNPQSCPTVCMLSNLAGEFAILGTGFHNDIVYLSGNMTLYKGTVMQGDNPDFAVVVKKSSHNQLYDRIFVRCLQSDFASSNPAGNYFRYHTGLPLSSTHTDYGRTIFDVSADTIAKVNAVEVTDSARFVIEELNPIASGSSAGSSLASGYMRYKGTRMSVPETAESGDVYVINNDFTLASKNYKEGTAVVYNGSLWKPLSPYSMESQDNKVNEITELNINSTNYPSTSAVAGYAERKKLFEYQEFYYGSSSYKLGFIGMFKEVTTNVVNYVQKTDRSEYWKNPLMEEPSYGYYKAITSDLCYIPIAYFTSTAGTETLKCWYDNDTEHAFYIDIIEDTDYQCYVIKHDYCPDVIVNSSKHVFEVYLKIVGKSGKTLHMQFVELINNNVSPGMSYYEDGNKFGVRLANDSINMEMINQDPSNYPLELSATTVAPEGTSLNSGYGYSLVDYKMLVEFKSSVDGCDDSSTISIYNKSTYEETVLKKGDSLFEQALAMVAIDQPSFIADGVEYGIFDNQIFYKFDYVDMWIHASNMKDRVTNSDIDNMWNS